MVLIWFPIGLVIGFLARYWREIGDYLWAWAQIAVPMVLVCGAGYLAVYGFGRGLIRLAAGMQARDKVPPINLRGYRARSSARRAVRATASRP